MDWDIGADVVVVGFGGAGACAALEASALRIRAFLPGQMNGPRVVGSKKLPTTVAGLLIHIADHTQRHVGQVVTTSKVLLGRRRQLPVSNFREND